MRHTEKVTPIAAAATAVGTLACCLPYGFAAAAALGTLSTVALAYRPWLLGASVLLLIVGALQVRRFRRSCPARSSVSVTILVLSAVTVLLVIFVPQVIASLLAGLP